MNSATRGRFRALEQPYIQDVDEAALVDAPTFLAHRLRQARSTADPGAALRSERDRRKT